MTRPVKDMKLVRFYLLTALGFLVLRMLDHLHNYQDTAGWRALNDTWRFLLILPLHFTLFEYAIPYVRKKRGSIVFNILIGVAVFIGYMMLYSWGVYAWRGLGIELGPYTSYVVDNEPKHVASEQMKFSVMTIFVFGVARHIYNYVKLRHAAQQLRIEKQQAELGYLKSQTNPHFLFNTLNNIYSLSRDKNDLAPESILRLSKILRFMLYEAGGDFIHLEQELKIINDYIELEKLRYDESLRISFSHDVEDLKQAVPPLLLMPLVENAFKHGVSETRELPFIDIHLSVKKRQLLFVVKNSSESTETGSTVKENIGLSNLRRQLQLLYTDHDLSVSQEPGLFTAVLKINLSSHV